MENLEIYNKVRKVPKEAQKDIKGGRLKGFTDINPMWRIKVLTEQFGMCGVGWYYEIKNTWLETAMAKDEITANVLISLYIKVGDEWSKPIQGLGGSMLVTPEKGGLYVDDECYKKALTDAISVACKSLGVGADVYWQSDRTKYTQKQANTEKADDPYMKKADEKLTEYEIRNTREVLRKAGASEKDMCKDLGIKDIHEMTKGHKPQFVKFLNDFKKD